MILLSGASASGKTVTALKMCEKYGFKKAITTTTREPRVGEKDGVDYFFISQKEFENRLNKDFFVESVSYNQNYYGSGKDQIGEDKIIVLELNGVDAYKALGDKNIIFFYLYAPEDVRYNRMISRGDALEKAKMRILNDRESFKEENVKNVDFRIDTSKHGIEEVADIIYKEYFRIINS